MVYSVNDEDHKDPANIKKRLFEVFRSKTYGPIVDEIKENVPEDKDKKNYAKNVGKYYAGKYKKKATDKKEELTPAGQNDLECDGIDAIIGEEVWAVVGKKKAKECRVLLEDIHSYTMGETAKKTILEDVAKYAITTTDELSKYYERNVLIKHPQEARRIMNELDKYVQDKCGGDKNKKKGSGNIAGTIFRFGAKRVAKRMKVPLAIFEAPFLISDTYDMYKLGKELYERRYHPATKKGKKWLETSASLFVVKEILENAYTPDKTTKNIFSKKYWAENKANKKKKDDGSIILAPEQDEMNIIGYLDQAKKNVANSGYGKKVEFKDNLDTIINMAQQFELNDKDAPASGINKVMGSIKDKNNYSVSINMPLATAKEIVDKIKPLIKESESVLSCYEPIMKRVKEQQNSKKKEQRVQETMKDVGDVSRTIGMTKSWLRYLKELGGVIRPRR